jgi:hypothetical protein
MPQGLFAFIIFQIKSLVFVPGWPGLQSSYFSFPHSWDDRHTTMSSFYWLRWDLTNFLPKLGNCDPPNLCFPSSWDYMHELPCPVPFGLCFDRFHLSIFSTPWCHHQSIFSPPLAHSQGVLILGKGGFRELKSCCYIHYRPIGQ